MSQYIGSSSYLSCGNSSFSSKKQFVHLYKKALVDFVGNLQLEQGNPGTTCATPNPGKSHCGQHDAILSHNFDVASAIFFIRVGLYIARISVSTKTEA